jgi:hypothetical protein
MQPQKIALGQSRPARAVGVQVPTKPAPSTLPPMPQGLSPALVVQGIEPEYTTEVSRRVAVAMPYRRFEGKASEAGKPITRVFKLAGVSRGKPVYSKYPFEELEQGQELFLIHDPYGQTVKPNEGHPDPTAVSVQDAQGRHVGYLAAAEAKTAHDGLAAGRFAYRAKVHEVVGGTEAQDGEMLHFGVRAVIHFFKTSDLPR